MLEVVTLNRCFACMICFIRDSMQRKSKIEFFQSSVFIHYYNLPAPEPNLTILFVNLIISLSKTIVKFYLSTYKFKLNTILVHIVATSIKFKHSYFHEFLYSKHWSLRPLCIQYAGPRKKRIDKF